MPEIAFNSRLWSQGAMNGCRIENNCMYAGKGAVYVSESLDALETSACWNYFTVSAVGKYAVSYFASNAKTINTNNEITNIDKLIEERDFAKIVRSLDSLWTHVSNSPGNAPFVNAEGRYLWFMVTCETEVVIQSFKLYFNITPLTAYLPEFYHNNEFLTRFLSMFQYLYTELNNEISSISRVLNYNCAEPDVLMRLAEWTGIADPSLWPENRLRALIKNAHRLFSIKGTIRCISDVIEIYTGVKPVIIEAIQALQYEAESLYGEDIYTVTALLNCKNNSETINIEKLAKIINYYKPMYVKMRIVVLSPTFILGHHTYLEINTELAVTGTFILDDYSKFYTGGN